MVNIEKNKYFEIINLLDTIQNNCNKILHSTIEFKEMLVGGVAEDLLINKMQERGILINKAFSFNEECNLINEFIRCLDDQGKKSLLEGLVKNIQQILKETTALDRENKLFIENKMDEIALNIEKIQDSKQLARSIDKNVNDNPSFIDVCG